MATSGTEQMPNKWLPIDWTVGLTFPMAVDTGLDKISTQCVEHKGTLGERCHLQEISFPSELCVQDNFRESVSPYVSALLDSDNQKTVK